MALAPLRIPSLQQSIPVVDEQGRMTKEFARRLNDIFQQLAEAVNAIRALPEIQEALANLDTVTAAAQAAADLAQAAADSAQMATNATAREAALQASYLEPESVLTASTTTITIAAHTRYYGDGTTASVGGGSVPATAVNDVDYVSYSDPMRAGGAVTYIVSTTNPAQTGDTHVVGAVKIPATGTAPGGPGPRKPGFVEPIE